MNSAARRLKGISRLLFGFILLVSLGPALPSSVAVTAPVDARVLADTANGQVGSFIVLLKDQADLAAVVASAPMPSELPQFQDGPSSGLSPASQTAAWNARGQAVVDGLHAAAARSQPAVTRILRAAGAVYQPFWIVNAIAVQGSRTLVQALAARPDVARVESNAAFKVPLETSASQKDSAPLQVQSIEPNLVQVHAIDLWAQGFTGQGMVFASADTGVDWTHPALKTHYRGWDANTSTADHNYNWWDAIHSNFNPGNSCGHDSPFPCDDNEHGTHTTGIGVGDDGAGHEIGMAPGAKWIACRNMDAGVGRPQYYIDCLQFFIAPTNLAGKKPDITKRPDAINNSYSCPSSEQCALHTLQTAVEAVRAAGIFMSVSAGNSGSGCGTVNEPPGLEASVFTVGAVDGTNTIAPFSSRGPVTADLSNRLKPQLVAPGVSVTSSLPGSAYGSLSGTSMSAPHVAGAVLLLWSAMPFLRRDVSLTESLFEHTATPMTSSQGCGADTPTSVPNNVYGYGLLNVEAAYQYAKATIIFYFFPMVPNQ